MIWRLDRMVTLVFKNKNDFDSSYDLELEQ